MQRDIHTHTERHTHIQRDIHTHTERHTYTYRETYTHIQRDIHTHTERHTHTYRDTDTLTHSLGEEMEEDIRNKKKVNRTSFLNEKTLQRSFSVVGPSLWNGLPL